MFRSTSKKPLLMSISKGFTLIEVMVVVVILGILASLIVPKVIGQAEKARVDAAFQDIATLKQALAMYRLDNYVYPTTEQGLKALVTAPTVGVPAPNYRQGGYLDKTPNDPWGRPYQYLSPGLHGEIDIYSLGPNGEPDQGDTGDDVASWKSKK